MFCVCKSFRRVFKDSYFCTDGDSQVDVQSRYYVVDQIPFVLEEGAVKALFGDTLRTPEIEIDGVAFILYHFCRSKDFFWIVSTKLTIRFYPGEGEVLELSMVCQTAESQIVSVEMHRFWKDENIIEHVSSAYNITLPHNV